MELGKDEAVQERVLEVTYSPFYSFCKTQSMFIKMLFVEFSIINLWKVARQFFSNSNITVNLLPALIIGGWLFDSFFLIFS